MRPIAINGRFLIQAMTGVQRYGFEVVRAMDEMLASGELEPPDAPVEILVPPGATGLPQFRFMQFRFMKVRSVGWGSGQVWEQLCLPISCVGKLLFTPCGGAPLLHDRHVFTIPDAGVFATPNAYSSRYGAWYRLHHRLAVRKPGLRLLTVSEFSKRELVRWLGVDPQRVVVTPEGHEHALTAEADDSVLERLALLPRSYLLGVGSANPNKNFGALLAAFEKLQRLSPPQRAACRLVVTGAENARVFGRQDGSADKILRAGYVSDGELRALYENAACFVFPSLYEGFGLPPLEAMALGCAVVCSKAASLPEVCGDAALLVDARQPDAIAKAAASLLMDDCLRKRMVERGLRRREMFRWRETARATWKVLLKAARS